MKDSQKATLYHVAPDGVGAGEELLSLLAQVRRGWLTADEAERQSLARWPDYDGYLASGEADLVHLYETLTEAREHASEYGGHVLAVDVTDLVVRTDSEGFPAVYDVPAGLTILAG